MLFNFFIQYLFNLFLFDEELVFDLASVAHYTRVLLLFILSFGDFLFADQIATVNTSYLSSLHLVALCALTHDWSKDAFLTPFELQCSVTTFAVVFAPLQLCKLTAQIKSAALAALFFCPLHAGFTDGMIINIFALCTCQLFNFLFQFFLNNLLL